MSVFRSGRPISRPGYVQIKNLEPIVSSNTCAAQITHNCLELRDGLLVTVFVEDEGHTVECSRGGHWDLKRWADLLLSSVVRGVWGVPGWLNVY